MPKKLKSLTINLVCSCGQAFMAIYKHGKRGKTAPCPRCGEAVRTDGKPAPIKDRETCPWCKRANWLQWVGSNTGKCRFCAYEIPKQ